MVTMFIGGLLGWALVFSYRANRTWAAFVALWFVAFFGAAYIADAVFSSIGAPASAMLGSTFVFTIGALRTPPTSAL